MEIALTQIAIELGLGALCLVGYRVEKARGKKLEALPEPTDRSIVEARVVGDGEWVALGSSIEESFESMTAAPFLDSLGFELEIDGRRIEIAQGTKVEIRSIAGARRAPFEGLTTRDGMKTRFTFEVRPGSVLFLDSSLPQLHAYRDQAIAPARWVVLGGSRAVLLQKEPVFAGCWLMILVPGLATGLIASSVGAFNVAWVAIVAMVVLIVLGYTALPAKPRSR